jgi:hypothetical protein
MNSRKAFLVLGLLVCLSGARLAHADQNAPFFARDTDQTDGDTNRAAGGATAEGAGVIAGSLELMAGGWAALATWMVVSPFVRDRIVAKDPAHGLEVVRVALDPGSRNFRVYDLANKNVSDSFETQEDAEKFMADAAARKDAAASKAGP